MSEQNVLLRVSRGDEPVQVLRLGTTPLRMGRGPGNDVMVTDPAVSGQHATLWLDAAGAWIVDHGSRNGTFVNGQRIRGAVRIHASDDIRVGPFHLRLEGPVPTPRLVGWSVEDIDAGLRMPVPGRRFTIGTAPEADLVLPKGDPREACLFFREDGEIWLSYGEVEGPVESGATFTVAGRKLRLIPNEGAVPPTQVEGEGTAYDLHASLNGATGPVATLVDAQTGLSYTIDTDNRAVLLYLLGRQLQSDRAVGTAEAEAGWCGDEAVSQGIWGRLSDVDTNNLHVLVYRLRKEIERAGFDPWFIEKRRRAIRARLQDVRIE